MLHQRTFRRIVFAEPSISVDEIEHDYYNTCVPGKAHFKPGSDPSKEAIVKADIERLMGPEPNLEPYIPPYDKPDSLTKTNGDATTSVEKSEPPLPEHNQTLIDIHQLRPRDDGVLTKSDTEEKKAMTLERRRRRKRHVSRANSSSITKAMRKLDLGGRTNDLVFRSPRKLFCLFHNWVQLNGLPLLIRVYLQSWPHRFEIKAHEIDTGREYALYIMADEVADKFPQYDLNPKSCLSRHNPENIEDVARQLVLHLKLIEVSNAAGSAWKLHLQLPGMPLHVSPSPY